jgi:2-C-methyl-D-erythritol 4-phosphate cytidylyltransferase
VKDTIKEVNAQSLSVNTPDRSALVAVQTPQGVNVDIFLKTTENADMSSFTDDTSVMEFAGVSTFIVEGDYKNIKITTPEDIDVAEALAGQKEW